VSVLPIASMDRRTTECLTSDSLGDISWVQKATLQLYWRNMPLLHTSRYVIAHDQFYQAFPTLVLQATNAGVRGLGTRLAFCLWSIKMHHASSCTGIYRWTLLLNVAALCCNFSRAGRDVFDWHCSRNMHLACKTHP